VCTTIDVESGAATVSIDKEESKVLAWVLACFKALGHAEPRLRQACDSCEERVHQVHTPGLGVQGGRGKEGKSAIVSYFVR